MFITYFPVFIVFIVSIHFCVFYSTCFMFWSLSFCYTYIFFTLRNLCNNKEHFIGWGDVCYLKGLVLTHVRTQTLNKNHQEKRGDGFQPCDSHKSWAERQKKQGRRCIMGIIGSKRGADQLDLLGQTSHCIYTVQTAEHRGAHCFISSIQFICTVYVTAWEQVWVTAAHVLHTPSLWTQPVPMKRCSPVMLHHS